MLVLTRRRDEAVLIGDDITVMVVEIRGDKVRLGITGPSTVQIDREEVRRDKLENGIRKEPQDG